MRFQKVLAGFFILFVSNFSLADYSLRWSPLSGNSSGGSAISVDLFLDEVNPNNTNSIRDFGVSGASYQVDLTGVGTLDVPVENIGFDDMIAPTTTGTSATVVQTSFLGLTDPNNSLKIGTFLINPTSNGPGSLAVSLLNPGFPGDIVVLTNMGEAILDGIVIPAATFSYEFTAVPEPTSILTVASLASFGVYRRRRRKVSPEEALRVARWKKAVRHHRKHYSAQKRDEKKWFDLGRFFIGTRKKVSTKASGSRRTARI